MRIWRTLNQSKKDPHQQIRYILNCTRPYDLYVVLEVVTKVMYLLDVTVHDNCVFHHAKVNYKYSRMSLI